MPVHTGATIRHTCPLRNRNCYCRDCPQHFSLSRDKQPSPTPLLTRASVGAGAETAKNIRQKHPRHIPKPAPEEARRSKKDEPPPLANQRIGVSGLRATGDTKPSTSCRAIRRVSTCNGSINRLIQHHRNAFVVSMRLRQPPLNTPTKKNKTLRIYIDACPPHRTKGGVSISRGVRGWGRGWGDKLPRNLCSNSMK